jgi:hypothetical protein
VLPGDGAGQPRVRIIKASRAVHEIENRGGDRRARQVQRRLRVFLPVGGPVHHHTGQVAQPGGIAAERHRDMDLAGRSAREAVDLSSRLMAENGAASASQDHRPQVGSPGKVAGERRIDTVMDPLPAAGIYLGPDRVGRHAHCPRLGRGDDPFLGVQDQRPLVPI